MRGVAGVVWKRSGSTTWLTGAPGVPVVAGLTVDAGHAQQDPRHLGVAPLVAAWLTREVARPGVDGPASGLQVVPSLQQSELTVALSGPADAVGVGLARLSAVLPAAAEAVVDDELRSRARMIANPLVPWSAHLAARWRGAPFVLSALGPLALDTLDAAAMAAYVAAACDARLFWTTDPDSVVPAGPVRPGARGLPPPRTGPAGVLRRNDGELASTVADAYDPADRVALSVLAAALHRRLVELQPLAADVRLRLHPLPGRTGLVTCVLVGPQAADADVLAAVAETTEDLPGAAAAEIGRIRRGVAGEIAAADEGDPATLAALARRQLAVGGDPTPERIAEAVSAVTDDEVRDRLAGLHRHLLLASAGDSPYDLVEPLHRPAPGGSRHRSIAEPGVLARCSDVRVGRVRLAPGRWFGHRETTLTSVDFDQLVLRIDAGPGVTGLVDADLASVQLVYPTYRRGDGLRAEVDARTGHVPVVRQREAPEVSAWAAELVRRDRRARIGRLLIALVLVLGSIAAIVAGVITT